mgnify:CR=1 FL=1
MQGQKERVVAELTDLLQNQPLRDVRKIRVMAALVVVHILFGDLAVAFSLCYRPASNTCMECARTETVRMERRSGFNGW